MGRQRARGLRARAACYRWWRGERARRVGRLLYGRRAYRRRTFKGKLDRQKGGTVYGHYVVSESIGAA